MDYSRKFIAVGKTPFIYDLSDGRLPNGLIFSGNEISGNPIEIGVFNFIVKAYIPNVYQDIKLYTLRVKPLVSIRQLKLFPLDTISLPSGTSFEFLDPQLSRYIQQCTLYYGEGPLILGNSIFDTGIQFSISKPKSYRYVFGVVDNPKRFFSNVDYIFIFKVFDEDGNLIPNLNPPISLDIYLDSGKDKNMDIFIASNPQALSGSGELKQKLGTKYKYSCEIRRGDGANLIYMTESSESLDGRLLNIFEHLDQVDRFLLSDYMTSPQLYIESNFETKVNEWKSFIENKFPVMIENKKLSEL
jgi:hypothetical protein